ncbi:MAG TPA: hypothetical protein VHA54_05535 [Solirubrobacterales bacterium]|nr:hypothetical protein [Solirubrobacterales bacterium]
MAVVAAAFSLAVLLGPGRAAAATTVYPAGGSGFSAGAEGWTPGPVSCSPIVLLCTPEAAYDPGAGNPPGSISARTTVTVNLISLFKGTETWSSPQFTVPVGAVTGASLRLERAFDAGGLVNVEPKATYAVTLRDLSAGTSATVLSEEVGKADTTFAARVAAASVVSGHTYQLSIEATTAQSALALSLLTGTTNLRFDNVGLQVETAEGGSGGGGGGGGGGGSAGGGSGGGKLGGLSDTRLLSLLRSSGAAAPVVTKGRRLFARVSCPAAVGRTCRIVAQGLLNRRRPATTRRTVRVAAGKSKLIALRAKPRARGQLAKRRRLLLREAVHAGPAKATVVRSRKLIRR